MKTFVFATIVLIGACTKNNQNIPIVQPPVVLPPSIISFVQDATPIKFNITNARREQIANIITTTIEGKLADTVTNRNNLVIRVTGDSARLYQPIEILVSYTDSIGNKYANLTDDASNKVTITQYKKVTDGAVQGSFSFTLYNSAKTNKVILKDGDFKTRYID